MKQKHFGSVKPERVVLYGADVRHTAPPRETLAREHMPVVTFIHPDGTGFGLDLKQLSRGVLLCGETGCGKTTVLNHCLQSIFRQMGDRDICYILDVKGEFAQKFFDPRNKDHLIFCGTGPYSQYSSAWNIYREVYAAASAEASAGSIANHPLETYAYDIAKDVFYGRGGSAQPFFNEAAQTLFAAVLTDQIGRAAETKEIRLLNNAGLVHFFKTATPQVYADLLTRYPQLKNYLGEKENNQSLGVLGSVNSAVNNSFVGVFGAEAAPRSSFTITDLMEQRGGKVLFIEMDLALAESQASMYRLLVGYILKSVMAMRNTGEGNVWLIFDELSTLPELKSFPTAMNLCRSKGLKCLAAAQSVSQLQTKYSEADAASLLEGFTNIIAFRNSDKNTRETISRRSGSTYEHISYRVCGSYVERQREGNAIEDWDILSLDTGEAYVLLSGYTPFRFRFPYDGS